MLRQLARKAKEFGTPRAAEAVASQRFEIEITQTMAVPRILVIASGGGHWIELMRLSPAFQGTEPAYVSMFKNYETLIPQRRCYVIPDGSRFNLLSFIPITLKSLWIIARERPQAIVTTGSAPMLPLLFFGRLIGSRTLWIDSLANSETMSTSGRIAKRFVDCCLAQWPEVAEREGIEYWGSVA